MQYYLDTYLNGMDSYQACARFGLDYAIYVSPDYVFDEADLAMWQVERRDLGLDNGGNRLWEETITTPSGVLHHKGALNCFTGWETSLSLRRKAISRFEQSSVPSPPILRSCADL